MPESIVVQPEFDRQLFYFNCKNSAQDYSRHALCSRAVAACTGVEAGQGSQLGLSQASARSGASSLCHSATRERCSDCRFQLFCMKKQCPGLLAARAVLASCGRMHGCGGRPRVPTRPESGLGPLRGLQPMPQRHTRGVVQ
jgi:hypothetical protein